MAETYKPMDNERLDDLRRTPRQANVSDVEDLCSEIDYLRSEVERLADALLRIRDANGPHGDTSMTRAMMRAIAGDALCADPRLHITEVVNPVTRRCRDCKEPWIDGDEYCRQCGSQEEPVVTNRGNL